MILLYHYDQEHQYKIVSSPTVSRAIFVFKEFQMFVRQAPPTQAYGIC